MILTNIKQKNMRQLIETHWNLILSDAIVKNILKNC